MNLLRTLKQTESERRDHSWGSLRFFAGTTINGPIGLSAARVVIKSKTRNPRHSHPSCDEILYLLAGKLTHYVGSDAYEMSAGDCIAIPKGVPHYAINDGAEDADMIVAYSSGERDFRLEPESE